MENKNNIQYRVIFFHMHPSSARFRFLHFNDRSSIIGFTSFPKLSALIDDTNNWDDESLEIVENKLTIIKFIQDHLPIDADSMELMPQFYACVDSPDQLIVVSLVRFTELEPPFDMAQKCNAEFRELPNLRNVHNVELQLLQKAYHLMMG